MKNPHIKKLSKYLLSFIPDEIFLRLLYLYTFKKILHLHNPKTFNEKIQYFKIHQTAPIFSQLADKYAVRDYIKAKVPEGILIPLLWFGQDPQQIPFETLPERFIIKCNHGSKYNIFVYDKQELNKEEVKAKLILWLKQDYSDLLRENQYKRIKEKYILIEELLPGELGPLPFDYRFNCFAGETVFISVSVGRETPEGARSLSFTPDWHISEFGFIRPKYEGEPINKPENFDRMLEYARRLSAEFPYARIDLYNIAGKIYFGEITFTPHSGMVGFFPDSHKVDRMLGELVDLNKKDFLK